MSSNDRATGTTKVDDGVTTWQRGSMSKPKAINPDHYSQMAVEPIDVIESCGMDYHVASAVAYLMRGGRKGDAIDDYKKALNFLHRRIYGTWFTEPAREVTISYLPSWNDGADGETP